MYTTRSLSNATGSVTTRRESPLQMRGSSILVSCVACFCAMATTSDAGWSVSSFGSGVLVTPFEVKTDEGRNDGVRRVYVTERNGRVLEWSYSGGTWSYTVVAASVTGLAQLAIGDARNDGTNRLYWSEFVLAGGLYEAEWNGASWDVTLMHNTYKSLNIFNHPDPTTLGKGRNDGLNRIFVNGGDGKVEYSYSGRGWSKHVLDATAQRGNIFVARVKMAR